MEFGTQAVVTVLFDVLVGIVLTGGAGIAVRYSAKVATTMTRAAKQQARMAKLAATLIAMSKKHNLVAHIDVAKPVLVTGGAPLNPLKKADLQLIDRGASTLVEKRQQRAAGTSRAPLSSRLVVHQTPPDTQPTPLVMPARLKPKPARTTALCPWSPARSYWRWRMPICRACCRLPLVASIARQLLSVPVAWGGVESCAGPSARTSRR